MDIMSQQIAYDPDFDTPPDAVPDAQPFRASSSSMFDALGPRRSFILGFVFSLMLIASAGFLILASSLLS